MIEMTASSRKTVQRNGVADAVHDKLKGDARNGSSPGREIGELAERAGKAKRLNARGYQSVVGGETMKKTYKLGAFVTREVRLLKCPHCGHEWPTKSKMAHVSCPNCARKVRVK